ncbi:Hypothetical predicted protein [Mytilus galloprovincialis]|uniref:MADF domain-containing protein n=1 Tax=Mytilus galloprovincialis TaxID=29158 RepID=A0A8B6CK95_MYTGA|nr:Hypothetical predicted protein [Mytilus galloprovincialis]
MAAQMEKRDKRSNLHTDLTFEEEQNMVKWMEAHPILYNKKMTTYKDTGKKEKMWLDKAKELGKFVLVLKTWYSSMRTRYGRLKKTKSGDGDKEYTERDDWVINNFDFLHPHGHGIQKKTSVSMKKKLLAAENCASSATSADEIDEIPVDMPSIPKTTGLKSKAHKHKHDTSETDDVLLADIEDRSNKMMVLQQQVLERLRPVSSDRKRDASVDWIRTVITELDHVVWR